jgi:hypothetical protein
VSFDPLTVTKVDAAGQPVVSYPGVLVYADDEVWAVRTRWEEPPWQVGTLTLATGGIMLERYYPGRWFNIMDLYSPVGVLLGWYCNITRPVEITPQAICWCDLALDLLVLPDGSDLVLDRDEYEALALPAPEREQAEAALMTLRAWARTRRHPFGRAVASARTSQRAMDAAICEGPQDATPC